MISIEFYSREKIGQRSINIILSSAIEEYLNGYYTRMSRIVVKIIDNDSFCLDEKEKYGHKDF